MGEVMAHLRETLPPDAIITNGAGNYTVWVHRFYHYRRFGTQLAPTAGSMGYGVPAAVAAKLRFPERDVVAFAGDGCFLMNGQEFATAPLVNPEGDKLPAGYEAGRRYAPREQAAKP